VAQPARMLSAAPCSCMCLPLTGALMACAATCGHLSRVTSLVLGVRALHACVWQFSGYSMPRHCPFPIYTSARRRPAAHEEHTTSSLCLSSALGCGDCLTPAQMQAELISITPQRDALLKVSLLVMRAFGPGPDATSSEPEPQALAGFCTRPLFSRHSGTTQRRSLELCICCLACSFGVLHLLCLTCTLLKRLLPAWRGTGPHDAGGRSCRCKPRQTGMRRT
jgi:hypothetical protein